MRLIELEKVLLTPQVASKEPIMPTEINSKNRISNLNDLNLAFGTKKSRKLVERRIKMATNVDKLKDRLDKIAASKIMTEMDLTFPQEQDVK